VHVDRAYDVPPIRLFTVLTDLEFLTERSRRYGGVADPTVQRLAGEVVVTTARQIPIDKLPSPARRYAGDGRIEQVDRWSEPASDDALHATIVVDAGKMPLEMAGRHEIRVRPGGCVYAIDVDIDVHVPVVGRAIRGSVASQLEKLLTAELAFTESWLSQHGA
jgi:hypothetical protein